MAPIVLKSDLDTPVPRGFPNFDTINYPKIPAMTSTTRLPPFIPESAKSRPTSSVRGGERRNNIWDTGRGI